MCAHVCVMYMYVSVYVHMCAKHSLICLGWLLSLCRGRPVVGSEKFHVFPVCGARGRGPCAHPASLDSASVMVPFGEANWAES